MTIQELGTIAQEKLAVKIVILNNDFLGMVRQWQELFFEKRYSFTEINSPDFVKLADAYGIPGAVVSDRKDLEPAMKAMIACEGPYLLEVKIEQEDNIFPMVPAGATVSNCLLGADEL
jgi:acetolactate synthase-1/2/3 large subunit